MNAFKFFNQMFLKNISGYFRLMILAMTMGIVLLFSAFSYYEIENAKAFAIRSFEGVVSLQAGMIDYWFRENSDKIKMVAQLDTVRRGDTKQSLDVLKNNSPEFSWIAFVNGQGIMSGSGINVADREYFLRAKKGESYVTNTLEDRVSHERVVLFSSPVYDLSGKFSGVVAAAVKLDAVAGIIDDFSIGQTGHIYLRDKTGEIIGTPSVLSQLGSNRGLEKWSEKMEALYREGRATIYSGVYQTAGGANILGAYTGLSGAADWVVTGEIEESEVLAPVYKKMGMVVIFGAIVIVLFSLVTSFFLRRINSPVAALIKMIKHLDAGEYDLLPRNAGFTATAPEELVQIRDAFTTMLKRLLEDIDTLQALNTKRQETEELFRFVSENSSVGVYVMNEHGHIIYINPTLSEMVGYSVEEIEAQESVLQLVQPEQQAVVEENIKKRINGLVPGLSYEVKLAHKSGEIIDGQIYSKACKMDGKPVIVGTIIDVTQHKLWEDAICESEAKNKAIVQAIPDALVRLTDKGTVIEVISTKDCSLLEDPESKKGQNVQDIWPVSIAATIMEVVAQAIKTGERQICEYEREEAGNLLAKEVRIVPYGSGEVLLVIRDITQRKEMEEALKYTSYHDGLTGLYNRSFFEQELQVAYDEQKFPIGILVADLDALKLVNDSLGHEAGDQLLLQAANVIQTECGKHIAARIGGDEFVILLEETSTREMQDLHFRIQESIEKAQRKPKGVPLYISIGISMGYRGQEMNAIFRRADDAMYLKKKENREKVQEEMKKAIVKLLPKDV